MWFSRLSLIAFLSLQASAEGRLREGSQKEINDSHQDELFDSLLLNRVLEDQSLPPSPPISRPTSPPRPVGPPPTAPTSPVGPPPTTPVAPVGPPPTTPVAPVGPPPTTPVAPVGPPPTAPVPTSSPIAQPVAPSPGSNNLLDVVKGNPDYSTLLQLIELTGRADEVESVDPLTLFAPTNAAFAAMGAYLNTLLNNADYFLHARSIVDNHVTPDGAFLASQLVDGLVFSMLSSETTGIINEGSVILDTMAASFQLTPAVPVITPFDETATNGVAHTVGTVLYPVWYFLDLMELLGIQSFQYSTLSSLIIAAGLDDEVASAQGSTLLAPNNAAFEALPPSVVEYLTDPTNIDALTQVLLYHFVPTVVNPLSPALDTDIPLPTYQGEDVILRIERGADGLADVYFNGVLSAQVVYLTQWNSLYDLPQVLAPPTLQLPS